MFTGIITAIGTVAEAEAAQGQAGEDKGSDLRLRITAPYDPASIALGASIACSGVCLTVVECGGTPGESWFMVDVSGETLARTAPAQWQAGARLNLERALRLGDELGGHIVTGHVDGLGQVVDRAETGGSAVLTISAPAALAPYIAAKGSVTVDGVSLTVNAIADQPDGACYFMLNIIPHTAEVTTLGSLAPGDFVNLEIDTLARYLQRMMDLRGAE